MTTYVGLLAVIFEIISFGDLIKFVSNKSIDELNKFRNDNIKYLKHNRDIMTNILFGDYSINELKFFEKLSNRKLF